MSFILILEYFSLAYRDNDNEQIKSHRRLSRFDYKKKKEKSYNNIRQTSLPT